MRSVFSLSVCMTSLKNFLYSLCGYLSGLCIVGITLLILGQILARFFGMIIPSAEDFAGYMLAASTFLGLAYTFREGGHIRVSLVIDRLPKSWRGPQEGIVLLMALALTTFMAWYCIGMVIESWEFGDVSHGYIPVPLWIVQLPLALGSVAFALAVLDSFIMLLCGKTPTYRLAEDELNLEEI